MMRQGRTRYSPAPRQRIRHPGHYYSVTLVLGAALPRNSTKLTARTQASRASSDRKMGTNSNPNSSTALTTTPAFASHPGNTCVRKMAEDIAAIESAAARKPYASVAYA